MKYLGLFSSCVAFGRYGGERYSRYYSHSTFRAGKEVRWFEIIEDTSPQPVKINRSNLKQFHLFFTQPQYI